MERSLQEDVTVADAHRLGVGRLLGPLALGVVGGCTLLGNGEAVFAEGFVEDSKLTLTARNYYFGSDRRNGRLDQEDWTQGFLLDYQSGFTQGDVGLGIDAFGYLGLKLDGGPGRRGTGNLPVHAGNQPADDYSRTGAAMKLRLAQTVVRYGQQAPTAPVFAISTSRLLPQTATGWSLASTDVANLLLEAGHFTSATDQVSTNHDGDLWAGYARRRADHLDFSGGKYSPVKGVSLSLYAAQLDDIWNQYYGNLNLVKPLSSTRSLTFDANLYRTLDTGAAKAGPIDNTAYSLAVAYTQGPQTFTLGWQRIDGDTPFDYVGFGDNGRVGGGLFLGNASMFSDFNAPNERSWQARYDLNFKTLGVPGLSLMTRYIKGSDIDGSNLPANSAYRGLYGADDRERELNLEGRYLVQSGSAKGLSIRVRQAWHRGSLSTGGSVDQLRVILDYPLRLL
ncbi:OprD family porin [Pseudomonas oryzihabitans]|uniref:OprD family porin n=1 Tax=Pseudomonas oryzihabitans TaxID=47885 RepID=UPI00289488AF|nr:OprD family porin [Pseudomonas oryzihabitans]MDT3722212.1 OprD family porin [Pseudomonas oryzihabitans]